VKDFTNKLNHSIKGGFFNICNKNNQRWLWYAISHDTVEIVSYTFGRTKNI